MYVVVSQLLNRDLRKTKHLTKTSKQNQKRKKKEKRRTNRRRKEKTRWFYIYIYIYVYIFFFSFMPCFPGCSDGKAAAYNLGDLGSISGLERSPGEGNDNPLQYFCLENPMEEGA